MSHYRENPWKEDQDHVVLPVLDHTVQMPWYITRYEELSPLYITNPLKFHFHILVNDIIVINSFDITCLQYKQFIDHKKFHVRVRLCTLKNLKVHMWLNARYNFCRLKLTLFLKLLLKFPSCHLHWPSWQNLLIGYSVYFFLSWTSRKFLPLDVK